MGKKYHYKTKLIILSVSAIILTILFSQVKILNSQASLPELNAHFLPINLANWQPQNGSDNYFSEIKITPVGYLIWTNFPLKIYIDQPTETDKNIASVRRFLKWLEIIRKGVTEWNDYFPMIEVENEELADILIKRNALPLKPKFNSETGLFDFPPATTAETKYTFYLSEDQPPLLLHKMTIIVSPNLADDSILSAIRHELGHALGIWGHSDRPTDALYYSQVKDTPPISERDINTLKKIYQQPTKLGWPINN
jgi:predicted Zn-dependent protease